MADIDATYPRVPRLFGLVLSGGHSSRFGRDKGAIEYHGRSQSSWAFHLLARHCVSVHVAVREAQRHDAAYIDLSLITDAADFGGPAAGLLAACRVEPTVAWLALAVDLPLIDDATLATLVAARAPEALATAYCHADGTPEPLCAIWEPRVRELLESAPKAAPLSLRRLLESGGARLLSPMRPEVLESVNTPAEENAVRRRLEHASSSSGSEPEVTDDPTGFLTRE